METVILISSPTSISSFGNGESVDGETTTELIADITTVDEEIDVRIHCHHIQKRHFRHYRIPVLIEDDEERAEVDRIPYVQLALAHIGNDHSISCFCSNCTEEESEDGYVIMIDCIAGL